MPAGIVVVLCDAVETERLIDDRQGIFRGVDRTFFERLEDFTAGQHGHGSADSLDHFAANAGKANLQAFEIGERLYRFTKPPGRLGTGQPAKNGVHVVFGVKRLAEFAPAGIEPPACELPGLHAERHGRDQCCGGNLPLIVAKPAVARLDLAVAHRIGNAESRNDLAGLEDS